MAPVIIINPDLEAREKEIGEILASQGLKNPHPNLLYLGKDQKLGIKDVIVVIEHLNLKPYQKGGQGVVILEAEELTEEAQNSLLKTLEESPVDSVIILGVANEDQLLPTILSRCQIRNSKLEVQNSKQEDNTQEIEALLNLSLENRFQFVEKIEDKQQFLLSLIDYFRHGLLQGPEGAKLFHPEGVRFLEDLVQAQVWFKQNVNQRAILEYLMLRLPGK